MKESKVKLSLDDFKALIKSTDEEHNDLLNVDNINNKESATDEDSIDWSPWFKAIYGR